MDHKKWRLWTKEEDAFLLAHPEETVKWQAEQLNRCAWTVKKARKRLGIATGKKVIDWSQYAPTLKEGIAKGLTDTQLAKLTGLHHASIRCWREREKIPANHGRVRKFQGEKQEEEEESKPPWSISPTSPPYSDEQRDWLKEITIFRQREKRIPSLIEAFRLAKRMGYRKVSGG